ncbi:MAG: hypothetical protein M1821_007809, partial [Bathelium mastoideum]
MLRQLRHDDYTVGWVCALSIELAAAQEMLNEQHRYLPHSSNDPNIYTLGCVGEHNVVLACLPAGQTGNNSAAVVATHMLSTFPKIRFGLMVGIGGGVPSEEEDIRLGDIVVSQPGKGHGGVIQYDFGKSTPSGFKRIGSLNNPPPVLLSGVSKLRASHDRGKSELWTYISKLGELPKFSRDKAGDDILFEGDYTHVDGNNCISCDNARKAQRERRTHNTPEIHYGTIASGNQVMRDGAERNKVSYEFGGVLCFEMEAAGLMNTFPCLVIRGICDYADSHKNKRWQPYAAGTAAAYAKELLSVVPAASVAEVRTVDEAIKLAGSTGEEHVEPALKRRKTDSHLPYQKGVHETIVLGPDQRRIYLDSLRFPQIDSRHATIRAAHAKTCKWLLDKSEYQDWLDTDKIEDHNGIFWIRGKPATGKSTIMKFAFSNAKKSIKGAIVISFFFNARGEELEKTVRGMYQSLLYQLLHNAQELQCVFDVLVPNDRGEDISTQWGVNRVKELFERAVERFGQRHLVCFIDALDECDEDEVREMLEFFERLAQIALVSRTRLHICFSSRHYPHITIKKGIQLTLEGQEGHQQDIKNYLHSELKAGQSKLVQQVKEEIFQRASGIFLWVVLVIKMLQKEYDRGNVHTLRKRLDEIPNGLFELFHNILTRDGQQVDELILCLQWVLFAKRPLRYEELYFGILTGLGDQAEAQALAPWDPEDITEQDMERFLLNSSKGLAELTKSKPRAVQFIHESVRDFLKEGKLDILTGTAFLTQSHERLKQCCQKYLSVDVSEHLPLPTELPIANSEAAADLRLRANARFPLLEYSVHNVLYHADAAITNRISQDTFIQGFNVQDWIKLDNLFERYQIRRYTQNASLLYILAEKNLPGLILTELDRIPHMDIPGERYSYPLCAAVVQQSDQAVRALLTPIAGNCSIEDSLLDPLISPTSGIWLLKDAYKSIRKNDQTPLLWAMRNRHEAMVRRLLDTGKVEVDSKDNYGQTPLSLAAENGHEAVVRQLLDTGRVDVDSKSNRGRTPLSWAALNGHEVIIRQLLDTGRVEVDSKDNDGQTPLSWAARNGHEAVVRQLLDTGRVEVDSKDKYGRTPLKWAMQNGHEAVVQQLLKTGRVEVDSKDNNGQTPLSWAAGNGHEAVVQQLLKTDRVEVDSKDNDGQTPLSWAAGNGHEAVLRQLLDTGRVEVDSKDKYGRTPLKWAMQNGHEAVVQQLLKTGRVEVDSKSNRGRTPLSWAAFNGHEVIVRQLLNTGRVEVDSKDNDGQTPLSWAAGNGHEAVVQQLLKTGRVEVDSKDNDGQTPLSWAAGNGHEAVLRQLLDTGRVE